MINFLLKKYPGSMIQPRRISQDMLEGFFGNIRELGGDSSTHTLNYSYEYYLKYYLTIRDYRKDKKISVKNNENITDQKHFIRFAQLSSLSSNVFKNLFADNLIMGRIEIPLESHDENVNQENVRIASLQKERCNLIETILYQDSINNLLQKYRNGKTLIKKWRVKLFQKKIGIQWIASWSSHLEIHLNNYQCSGIGIKTFFL